MLKAETKGTATLYQTSEAKSSNQKKTNIDIAQYIPLVQKIAQHLANRLPHNILLDDLVQSGMLGLLEAINKFDQENGASFETFATYRIRGAMLDEIRKEDWFPRSVHKLTRDISQAVGRVEGRTNQSATDFEIAEEMGLSIEDYNKILLKVSVGQMLGLDETKLEELTIHSDGQSNSEPWQAIKQGQFRDELIERIKTLPEMEQLILSLYYEKELNMKEIGYILELSESRICQVHSQAMVRLRKGLADWLN